MSIKKKVTKTRELQSNSMSQKSKAFSRTLKCKFCKNIWDYKGNSKNYATCPDCLKKVNIKDCRVV